MGKRRFPSRATRRGAVAMLALAWAYGGITPGASAYNQSVPPGGPNAIGDCLGTSSSPCIRWNKTASNLSINVNVYLSNTLPDQEIDLKVDARRSITTYNGIAARNPHLQEVTTSGASDFLVKAINLGDPFLYGGTTVSYQPTAPFRIYDVVMSLNTQIEWNRDYNYDCRDIPVSPNVVCKADAVKVMHHEFGHAEGLAHEGSTVQAIMRQGALTFHLVQADDRNGIIHIYGAYP